MNGANTVQVRAFGTGDEDRWDRFVAGAAQATFFHRAGWRRVIEQALGHAPHYLLAERNGQIAGVLPMAEVRSLLFGSALISTPFCVYGGAVADDEAARLALTRAACELADERRVGYLELRNVKPQNPSWPTKDLYVTFRKTLHADPEANLAAIPRKQRAMVRKGVAAGLEAEVDPGIDRFYTCYAESVRNLGTPVMSEKYFSLLRDTFREDCEVLTIVKAGEAIASVMSFYFRDEVLPYYGGGTARARELKANDFMYWKLMSLAAGRGVRLFDYGRSKRDTGSYRFKRHWGFEPEPLHYEYHLVCDRDMPDLSPANPKYRLFIALWKRLPLPVARLIGPRLARYLG